METKKEPIGKFMKWLLALGGISLAIAVFFISQEEMTQLDFGGAQIIIRKTTPVTIDKSDWKTYSNPTFKYSLQYPSTWAAAQAKTLETGVTEQVKDATIELTKGGTTQLTIMAEAKTKAGNITLEQYAKSISPADKTTITNVEDYKIGTLDGKKEYVSITDPASQGLWYFTVGQNYFYSFKTKEKKTSAEITGILQSFLTNDQAVLKSYSKKNTSSGYTLSFQYPSAWTIDGETLENEILSARFKSGDVTIKISTPLLGHGLCEGGECPYDFQKVVNPNLGTFNIAVGKDKKNYIAPSPNSAGTPENKTLELIASGTLTTAMIADLDAVIKTLNLTK